MLPVIEVTDKTVVRCSHRRIGGMSVPLPTGEMYRQETTGPILWVDDHPYQPEMFTDHVYPLQPRDILAFDLKDGCPVILRDTTPIPPLDLNNVEYTMTNLGRYGDEG